MNLDVIQFIVVQTRKRWGGRQDDEQQGQQQAKWRLMELLRLHVKHEVITALDLDLAIAHHNVQTRPQHLAAVANFDLGNAQCTMWPLRLMGATSEAPLWEISVPCIYGDEPDERTVYKVQSRDLESELLALAGPAAGTPYKRKPNEGGREYTIVRTAFR